METIECMNKVCTNQNKEYNMFCPECGAPISQDDSYYDEEYEQDVYVCHECGADCSLDQLEFVPTD